MEEKKVNIREMTMEDFEEVHALWMGITGLESGVLMIRKKVWNALSDAIRPRGQEGKRMQ